MNIYVVHLLVWTLNCISEIIQVTEGRKLVSLVLKDQELRR